MGRIVRPKGAVIANFVGAELFGTKATLGPELITNGKFDANVDGWLPSGNSAVTWDGGRMRLNPAENNAGAYTVLASTTEMGPYIFSFDWEVQDWAAFNVLQYSCGTSETGNQAFGGNFPIDSAAESGHFSERVTSNSALSTYLRIAAGNSSGGNAKIWIDNISLRKDLT